MGGFSMTVQSYVMMRHALSCAKGVWKGDGRRPLIPDYHSLLLYRRCAGRPIRRNRNFLEKGAHPC